MATPTIEEIQRAIDGASAAGDQQAVDVLKARQSELIADQDSLLEQEGVRPRDRALPPHMDQDPVQQVGGPALAEPSTDEQIDNALSQRIAKAGTQTKPAPKPEPKPLLSERERELAQVQYDADQELIASGNVPTPEQLSEFMGMNAKGISPGDIKDGLGRQIIVDPKTGKARWSAITPDQMENSLQRKNRGSTSKATVGALGYGSTRIAGAALSSAEADIASNNYFQEFLLTGEKGLSEAEQKRIMGLARKEYGKDVTPSEIDSRKLKEWIDMNPENELAFRDIAGDEWWEQRKEFGSRLLARIGQRGPMIPPGAFGADDASGDLFGPGSFENIDYTGKRAPAYTGASDHLRRWKADAKKGTGVYEGLILPLVQRKTGKSPATHATEFSKGFIDKYYDEEQLAEREMSIFTQNVEVKNLGDLWPLVRESFGDPNTKLANPESAWLMFAENAPELGVSFAFTRGAGAWSARATARESYGLTVSAMDKARTTAAGRGGMLAGGATEGILVKEHLEQETREVLERIPVETWEKNDTFNEMVDAGVTQEGAKQIMSQERATHAGNTAAVVTMATGAPMNRFMGKSAAGRIVQSNTWARRGVGAVGEPVTEGLQEVMEMVQTEMAVRPIDPDNPIYDDPNRYAEAFGGGALISGPFGMMAALEPDAPVGVKKEDVDAARATVSYMEATNDRFKFETKISDPEHIANTTPMNRLKELNQLEQMQIAEAEAILKAEPKMRAFLEKQGTKTAETEIKMLNRLVMRANAMKNDIAVARSKRTTATKLQQAEKQVMRDRAELQQKVNEAIVSLEDIEGMTGAIESVQNLEAIPPEMEETLVKEGYARRTKSTDKLVVTPKGRRATKELNRQARGLRGRLEKGYTGTERRQPENLIKRDLITSAGPVEREQMLYQDNLTGAQNRRAFNERQEHIDVREGKDKRTIEGAQPAVAAIDVDSLAWVNDNMSHSAGDRLLVAVSDALAKQPGVEVFRLGGDEFAVTGASQEALETALQAAATELSETEIAADEDVVTPQITWGKGETYKQADADSLAMKQDRQQRGIVASRKEKAATYRHRAQQGLFNLDSGEGGNLPRHWSRVKDNVERGDSIEVLTPDGAVQGVITNVTNRRGRPRIRANIQGRSFLFNPQSNHLIVDKMLSPTDLAWLTGDAEYAQPGRETFPQTLIDINIGHLGKDGQWYADLADDFEYVPLDPWWVTENQELGYSNALPFMPPVETSATADELLKTEYVRAQLTKDMGNLPDIHVVESISELKRDFPQVAKQIRDELIAMGGSGSFAGVRGYMDHIDPANGIFIFPAHIPGDIKSGGFESNVVETIWHEMIGHYGVRGMFGYEADLRVEMHNLVDAFPRLADNYAVQLGLDKTRPDHKQLLGEEMVAYIAGKVRSGEYRFNQKQKGAWARFVAWVKEFMSRHKMGRYAPMKKMVTLHDSREVFWNDDKVQDLLSRSRDFVRHGNGFEWTPLEDTTKPWMRDRDIFQAGLITAMNTATFKPNNREKGELAKRYGGKENVPAEVPLFPDDAAPNAWKQLLVKARKENMMTERELELSGLSEKSDFYLFRDASYGTLERYMQQIHGNHMPDRWYAGILPQHIVNELDEIGAAMQKNHIAGPLRVLGMEGYGEDERLTFEPRPVTNQVSADLMRARIAEIMTEKINPKKTRLTKQLMQAHMMSENAYRIFIEKQGQHPTISRSQAMERLYGRLTSEEIDALTDEQKKEITAERERSKNRGYDIGYDKDLDRWFDWAAHTTSYSEWSPQGSKTNGDFRVALIKSEGKGGDMGYSGHYDKNVAHIRTGVAELLDWEGMPELEFPNPAMQGKMLSLIELQSDWLQSLRKGFSSYDEKDAADQEFQEKRKLLEMVGNNLGTGIGSDIWTVLDRELKPIINLPDGSTEGISGSAFGELRRRANDRYGTPWDNLTESQKRDAWKEMVVEKLDALRDDIQDAHDGIVELEEALPKKEDVGGRLDLRGFELLDAMATRRAVMMIKNELTQSINTIQNDLRYSTSQERLVQQVADLKRRIGGTLQSLGTDSARGETLRLPMVEYQLKPILDVMYGRLGADKNRVGELMSALKVREMVTVRIPRTALMDANTAMTAGYEPVALMAEIIAESRVSRHSDIVPGSMAMRAVRAGDDFVDVKVVGSKGDVAQVERLIPKLISTWLDNHGAEKRRIAEQRRTQPDVTTGAQNPDYTYSDIEDLFNLEEEDTDGEQSSTMRDHGVMSYYEFEENERGEIESDIIDNAFYNMSEGDWDNIEENEGVEGVSRQGETYRDEIVVDADGDTDNETAERNLSDARDEYRTDYMYQDDAYMDQAYEQVRELWNERGQTALIIGSIPISWDESNEPYDYVEVMIKAEDPGDAYDMIIDGDEVDYESDYSDAKDGLSDQIYQYYQDNNIVPPAGAPYGPDEVAVPELVGPPAPDPAGPNWDMVKSNIIENLSMMSDSTQKMDKVFEQLVTLQKRMQAGGVHEPSPVAKDEQWRPLALKYLIADAVRRGLGGVMWNNGMASSTRGGMGMSDVQQTARFTWSKETVGIRGEEQDVYVIRWPESKTPIVVGRSNIVPILGADVSRLIHMQETGKIEVPPMPGAAEVEAEAEANIRDNYIIGRTADGLQAVYRRSDNNFLGFAPTETDVNQIITNDAEYRRSSTRTREPDVDGMPPTGEPLGEVLASGMIDEGMVGGKIHIISGGRVRGYAHTFDVPRLAGARQSYEDITVRQWNKELKKYGVQISDTYVKVPDIRKAMFDEGQPGRETMKRDEQIAEQHGRLYVAELTGEMHGWVVTSEKNGPVINDVFTDKVTADRRLQGFIDDNFGSNFEGVKVMYFPINEKMREEFSGPVAPFHYDPTKDPGLKSAAKKVGYRKRPLRKRINEFREGMGAEARQGMIDQFYGLRRALNEAGVDMESYMSARLTTSLDSMMKAVLYYGHPVWEDGIVQNKGKGLLDIFQPILNDPDTWGLYMAGKRAKGLMLEGYDKLTPAERKEADDLASSFAGEDARERVFNMLVHISRGGEAKLHPLMTGTVGGVSMGDLDTALREVWTDPTTGSMRVPLTKDEEANAPKTAGAKYSKAKRVGKVKLNKVPRAPTPVWDMMLAQAKANGVKTDAKWREKMDAQIDKVILRSRTAITQKTDIENKEFDLSLSTDIISRIVFGGREHLFDAHEIEAMVRLGEKFPHFERVAKDYAAFNKKMLDFGEASGVIDAESRPTWENADYVPFYRVGDDRLIGSGMSPTAGIANQRAPIRRLTGADERVGDIMGNIMMNVTKLMDASVKNNAALEAVDALRGSGIVSKKPMDWKPEMIPMSQLKKIMLDRGIIVPDDKAGIHLRDIPEEALTGMAKMFAMKAPSGDGVISVMRNGKREYYQTDDMLLWRSLGAINKKQFGEWINLFRAPKRLLTTLITIDPSFMIANFIRDTGSAFVVGRDHGNLPVVSAIKGFGQALVEDEAMRTMLGAGAAFENGYITGGDPRQTKKLLKAAMKKRGFKQSVLDSPLKLIRAWKHLGSSIENSNRMAIYNAAIAAGKSKKQAAYEAKDLMDFSMGGDWPVIQFLIQTVPFMNARAQGMYRLGRGFVEHPVAFTLKGLIVSMAGLALYGAFKDDERYKALEMWDRRSYYHWWIGDKHYRLPKPFEVGAIFNSIPEMMFDYTYSKENDAGKTLMREYLHMFAETFSMSPFPQTVAPIRELRNNWNYFTDRPIVSYYEQKRLPQDQYRTRTSPSMIELAKFMPNMKYGEGNISSPLHLQNLYAGYTGTIGRYILQASDMVVQRALDYPAPPAWEVQDVPVLGRFVRGENPPRRTKYETEVYDALNKTTEIQGSLAFHEKQGNVDEYLKTHEENLPYIRTAGALEAVRENISNINRAVMQIHLMDNTDSEGKPLDRDHKDYYTPERKQKEIDELEKTRNYLFKEGWKMRPGGEYNPADGPVTQSQVIDLIDNFGVDNSTAYLRSIQENAPDTFELLEMVNNDMGVRQLTSLAKINGEE